ncbi:DUF397 domain-containing protein [Streptomyces sp. XD-27]|uniref:DUF397 domain-containing protein n=1 Tax=Streptomyces sp. XD-27 TaxID=3062779 RepID=UPI0026F47571|nr:DUF397 domain-containing protein [Streptomyces sp. XD-27]WKX72691.1 DUF397 domain-containing protein [Streptomyces sp. XD-27]
MSTHTYNWFKSSHSAGNSNDCVEVANLIHTANRGVAIRDSKNPDGPSLLVTPDGWASFISSVRRGEFPTP